MPLVSNFGTGMGRVKPVPSGKFTKAVTSDGHVSKHPTKGYVARLKGSMDSYHPSEDAAHKHLDNLKKRRDFKYNDHEPRWKQLKDAGLM